MAKKLTVSLIIPCYNEEEHIQSCLRHVAAQDLPPQEVILVDNNCTDKTVEIAKQFPFVTVIKEKEQGLIPARNRGFEFAKGDILARIDADTEIEPNWIRTVRDNLSKPKVHGVTGPAKSIVEVHLPFLRSTLWSRLYFKFIKESAGINVLWGPNMAIRISAYKKIKHKLARDSHKFHEDQDISIWMHKYNLAISNLPAMRVSINGYRSARIEKIWEYNHRRRQTIEYHIANGNLPRKKFSIGSQLRLLAMVPAGLFLAVDGMIYSAEIRLGLRKQ